MTHDRGGHTGTRELLVATTNRGKVRELEALLPTFILLTPSDLELALDVEETGRTFVENARLKARAYYEATGRCTMGEDSGIEIDALDGAPGVYSARYEGLPDGPVKNAFVLDLLRNVPEEQRGCRYMCAIVLIEPDGSEKIFEGECKGSIAHASAGEGGFGYDPIFFVADLGRTMAELGAEEKNEISHRGRAVRKLARYL